MENFQYYAPTKVVFGKGTEDQTGKHKNKKNCQNRDCKERCKDLQDGMPVRDCKTEGSSQGACNSSTFCTLGKQGEGSKRPDMGNSGCAYLNCFIQSTLLFRHI